MKQIKIEEVHLLNFKGIRNLRVRFSDMTEVSGDNGLGKTTIADAIWWLLFGKDSQGREAFEIKTLDESGKPIEKLPHEVNGVITVDGEKIVLSRKFVEKWVKKNGIEEFRGHEIERYFNEIPCTKKEFEMKIAEICNEQDFKYLTNPFYFCAQGWEIQKAKLLEMAGQISDAEIAAGHKEFEYLLLLLSEKKTLAEFKKEIKAKKNRINSDIAGIPDRIDEQKRSMPENLDWAFLEKELREKEAALEDVQEQIMDIAKRNEARDNVISEIYLEINNKRKKISDREQALSDDANKGYYDDQQKWAELHQKALVLESDIKACDCLITSHTEEVEKMTLQRESLINEFKALSRQKREVEERSMELTEEQFICPTCRQQLPEEGIEAVRMELTINFNDQKKRELSRISSLLTDNMRKGSVCSKVLIDKKIDLISSLNVKKSELQRQYSEVITLPEYVAEPKRVDVKPLIDADASIAQLNVEIEELQREAQSSAQKIDFSDLSQKRESLKTAINTVRYSLGKKEQFVSAQNRIEELEGQYTVLAGKLEELDKLEKIISDFNKAKNEEIARRIDSLFTMVNFRWIALQVNGGERETCEVTVNGIPYASLNHAGKVNAGLDIINAIGKHLQIAAPIMVDNAESTNTYLPTEGQLILFKVSHDKELTVTNK